MIVITTQSNTLKNNAATRYRDVPIKSLSLATSSRKYRVPFWQCRYTVISARILTLNCKHHRTANLGLQSNGDIVDGAILTQHVSVMVKLNDKPEFMASLCIRNSNATLILVDARILRWPNVKTTISYEPIDSGFVGVTDGD